ncbi:DUF4199 domain-containing protein [Aquimarina sp. 2201CG5-10]|uniref:DUF4199 domain-containing protein n=1 Tax=Aquimarina callyspongiae TaxID=3098150 RepID=UPI002AB4FC6D|nr:DUF4199 domain-containing protein [Aquimarina sp. 2201CG5-10]MDY8137235.1 DUF4199 domain-containing protein [Aquimarina sp. 2201CG5-10]
MKETTVPSIKKIIITYGLVLGVLDVIFKITTYSTDKIFSKNLIIPLINLFILIFVIIYGIYKYKLSNKGFLKLSQALKIGIGIALISGIVIFIWFFSLLNFIDPEIHNQFIQAGLKSGMSVNPDMSQEEIEKSLRIAETFNSSYMKTAFSTVSNLLFGSIISLIGGVIMHKKRVL